MNEPEVYYNEEDGEYYTIEEQSGGIDYHGKSAVYVIGYFLVLAIIVVPAQALGLGMPGIFLSMAGAGLVLGAIILAVKFIHKRMAALHLSRGQFLRMLTGYRYQAGPGEESPTASKQKTRSTTEDATARSLVPANTPTREQIDADELPDEIIEENPMHLSDSYQPNVNGMLGATVLLCGRRRSGKSNGLGVIVEELAQYMTPLCLADTEDEYSGLVKPQFLPRGFMAGSMEVMHEARRAGIRYIPIDREGAYEFGQSIPRDVLQVVLNLHSFGDDDEAAMIMAEIIDGMNDWEQSQHNSKRVPCMFLLDEATKWLPQNIRESDIQDQEVLDTLQRGIFGKMVRRGGKRGLGLVLAVQRIAEVDKRAINQSVWKFLFIQDGDRDLAGYARLGLERDDVLSLRQGECYVFSPDVIGFRTLLRERHSPHLGHTPGLTQLKAHLRKMPTLEQIAQRTYASGPAIVSADQDKHTEELEETNPYEQVTPTPLRARAQTQEERALEAWNNGATSGRKLAAAMGIGESAGNQLMHRLATKGLIQIKTRRQAVANE